MAHGAELRLQFGSILKILPGEIIEFIWPEIPTSGQATA
jgi:hypothetical protein